MRGRHWTVKQLTTESLEMFSSLEALLLLPLWFVTFYRAWLILNRPDTTIQIYHTGYTEILQCQAVRFLPVWEDNTALFLEPLYIYVLFSLENYQPNEKHPTVIPRLLYFDIDVFKIKIINWPLFYLMFSLLGLVLFSYHT